LADRLNLGVYEKARQAAKWWLMAAEQGHAPSQYRYSFLYYIELRNSPDYKDHPMFSANERQKYFALTSKLTLKAAAQGHVKAQNLMGLIYDDGMAFGTRMYEDAFVWYSIAASAGDELSKTKVDELELKLDTDAVNRAKARIVAVQAEIKSKAPSRAASGLVVSDKANDLTKAFQAYRRAAEGGDPKAQFKLGGCYFRGEGVTKDAAEAVKWWRKAVQGGNVSAINNLGTCYSSGEGVSKDSVKAAQLFKLAAEKGDEDAQFNLAMCYYNGNGVVKDVNESFKWMRMAAEHGIVDALTNVGNFYSYGVGVSRDYYEAAKWWRQAAEKGDSAAQVSMGWCCARGNGVPQDWLEALKWYRMAAEQGDPHGLNNLGDIYSNGRGVPKDEVEGYAYYNLAAATLEDTRRMLVSLEEKMPSGLRLRGQQRSKEIQKEIDARKAAKNAGK
jgi:TPR repeat protein